MVVAVEHYFVVISAGVVAFLVQVRGNSCLRKVSVVGAIEQLSLIASTFVPVGLRVYSHFCLRKVVPI